MALVARPGPAGEPARFGDHLADRGRGKETVQLGHPAVAELILAGLDQGAVAPAGWLVNGIAPQVNDVLVVRRRAGGSHPLSIAAARPMAPNRPVSAYGRISVTAAACSACLARSQSPVQ